MQSRSVRIMWLAVSILAVGGLFALAQPKQEKQQEKQKEEQERKIEEKDVPKAALDALKKLAGGAAITEFSEEIEHGSKFYEGAWKGSHGKIEMLVTVDGDLVEVEETVFGDSVPKAVMAAAEKAAGKGAELCFEKKTLILYEAKFKKGDSKHELVLTPDGRPQGHEEEAGQESDD